MTSILLFERLVPLGIRGPPKISHYYGAVMLRDFSGGSYNAERLQFHTDFTACAIFQNIYIFQKCIIFTKTSTMNSET